MMATPRKRTTTGAEQAPEAPPLSVPQSVPQHSGADYNGFIWQQLSEIQRTLGAVQENQRQLSDSIKLAEGKLGGRLAAIDNDLAEIKQIKHTAKWMFAFAGVALSVVLTVCTVLFAKVWSLTEPILIRQLAASQGMAPSPALPPEVPAKKAK